MQLVKKKDNLLPIFFIIGSILFFLAIAFVKDESCKFVYFFSIVFCLLFVLISVFLKNKNYLFIAAMFFTVLADVFLVLVEPQNKSMGMFFFSFVQIFYFVILFLKESKKLKTVHIITRAVFIVIVQIIAILVLKEKTDFLSLISMFYYTNLILNLIFSFFEIKTNFYLVIGFLLFLCCDTIIGLQVASGAYLAIQESSFIYKIIFTDFNLAWLFYFPSQVFLSLSATNSFGVKSLEKDS